MNTKPSKHERRTAMIPSAQGVDSTIPLAPLLLTVLSMAGAAVALVLMGVHGAKRRVPPNDFFGIRTRFTRSGDAAWYAVHEASARWSILAGIAFLPAAILTPLISDPKGQVAAILIPATVGTGLLLVGSWRAHRVARRRLAREEGRADPP